MANENCNAGGVFVAFLAGGLIGAGLALLYAPVSGKEARVKISDVLEDMKKRSEGFGVDIKKKVETFMEEEKAIIKAAYDAGREAMTRGGGEVHQGRIAAHSGYAGPVGKDEPIVSTGAPGGPVFCRATFLNASPEPPGGEPWRRITPR